MQDTFIRMHRFANEHPEVNMWEILDENRARTKEKLAALVGCSTDEIALNRNSTEGLCTAIYGTDLDAGDEVLLSDWDYDSIRHAWEQRAQRDGIVVRKIEFDLMDSDDQIIAAYNKAVTPRTKVAHLTHMVHYTGRVLPVAALCRLCRERGIITMEPWHDVLSLRVRNRVGY